MHRHNSSDQKIGLKKSNKKTISINPQSTRHLQQSTVSTQFTNSMQKKQGSRSTSNINQYSTNKKRLSDLQSTNKSKVAESEFFHNQKLQESLNENTSSKKSNSQMKPSNLNQDFRQEEDLNLESYEQQKYVIDDQDETDNNFENEGQELDRQNQKKQLEQRIEQLFQKEKQLFSTENKAQFINQTREIVGMKNENEQWNTNFQYEQRLKELEELKSRQIQQQCLEDIETLQQEVQYQTINDNQKQVSIVDPLNNKADADLYSGQSREFTSQKSKFTKKQIDNLKQRIQDLQHLIIQNSSAKKQQNSSRIQQNDLQVEKSPPKTQKAVSKQKLNKQDQIKHVQKNTNKSIKNNEEENNGKVKCYQKQIESLTQQLNSALLSKYQLEDRNNFLEFQLKQKDQRNICITDNTLRKKYEQTIQDKQNLSQGFSEWKLKLRSLLLSYKGELKELKKDLIDTKEELQQYKEFASKSKQKINKKIKLYKQTQRKQFMQSIQQQQKPNFVKY